MIRKKQWILAIILITLSAVFGLIKRQSYTDITKEENYMDSLYVAVLNEEITSIACQQFYDMNSSVPIAAQVKVMDEIQYVRGKGRVHVQIEKVHRGDMLRAGDEIFVFSDGWSLVLNREPQSIECDFVNVMKQGESYLIFLEKEVEDLYTDMPVYKVYDEFILSPVFAYAERKNIPVKQESNGHSYIEYMKVKDNEFFGQTEKAVKYWEKLKIDLFELYPE